MESNKHTLKLENLQVGHTKPLLDGISVNFSSSSLIGIIGNNGKGKTTLLKTLAGLLPPIAGNVKFDEKDILELSATERARTISMSLSSGNFNFPISVFELVSMGRYPYNDHWATLRDQDLQIISNAMIQLGIKEHQDKPVTSISDGERQKALIAKTLVQATPVILFDEPTAFLDYSSKKSFFQLMKEITRQEDRMILVSSHDIDFLTAYADQLLMIEENGKVLCGKTTEIVESDYFDRHFTRK